MQPRVSKNQITKTEKEFMSQLISSFDANTVLTLGRNKTIRNPKVLISTERRNNLLLTQPRNRLFQ